MKTIEQRMQTCKHFNGIQHDACEAGVDYKSVRDSSKPGPYRWPCLTHPHQGAATTACERRELRTREEAEQEERETRALIDGVLAKIAAGICHVCDAKVEKRKQVGPCIYAEPCGHRIGQGTIPREDPK